MTDSSPGFALSSDDQESFTLRLSGDWAQGRGTANFSELESELENFTKDSRSFYDIVSWIGAHHYPRLLPVENSSYRQKVHPNVISHLKNYYLEDTNKLINDFNLKPPYANQ